MLMDEHLRASNYCIYPSSLIVGIAEELITSWVVSVEFPAGLSIFLVGPDDSWMLMLLLRMISDGSLGVG